MPRIGADNSASLSPRCTDAESLEVNFSTIKRSPVSGPTPLVIQEIAAPLVNERVRVVALWLA